MKSVVVMDLQGFSQLATGLALKMERINLNAERVRAITIQAVDKIIKETSVFVMPQLSSYIGGDTWGFVFHTAEDGVKFGCYFLRKFKAAVLNQGICHLKPSIAINVGEPVFKDGKFIDSDSIGAYTLADKGQPFDFYIHPSALLHVKPLEWVNIQLPLNPGGADSSGSSTLDWQNAKLDGLAAIDPNITIPTLILDSDTNYSETAEDAILQIIHQQRQCSESVFAFGGPIPFGSSPYDEYIKETIALIRSNNHIHWTILSYIPKNGSLNSYAWLELCRRMEATHPGNFKFSAFLISGDQLRPFSFQIFDKQIVHIGLRKYSPSSGTPVMSSAIMLRNKTIASRFIDEFVENWRIVGGMDDKHYGELLSSISGVTNEVKKKAHQLVDECLR